MVETQSQATLWPPPEGFVPIPSLLDGIEIYGPAPEETPEEETRSFKCPYCGSKDTRLENIFGPTPCRSIRYCASCRQPFEQFKTI